MSSAGDCNECPKCKKGAPKWLVTYSDMVTLLLCFFILLLAFANTDMVKFKEVLGSMKEAFGVQKEVMVFGKEGGQKLPIKMQSKPDAAEADKKRLVNLLKAMVEQENLQKNAFIVMDRNGVRMEIMELAGNVMFGPGDTKILPAARRLFLKLTPMIKETPYKITVQGHTDDIPITNSRFPSNWELSSARAGAVVRFFIQNGKLDDRRFSAVGCAHTLPLFENINQENRNKNRRVSILFEVF
ncbi:MAG: OmpA family protein [bacterium]|nr:OmpA family protein [bacterium]